MKRILLTTAVALVAAGSFAQNVQKAAKVTKSHANVQSYLKVPAMKQAVSIEKAEAQKLPMLMRKQEMATSAPKTSRRVQSDGVLYLRPEGTLFGGWDWANDGRGYRFSRVIAPIMTDLTFRNRCAGDASWSINGTPLTEENASFVDGNLLIEEGYTRGKETYGSTLYYTPTVTTRDGEFTLNEYNVYYKRNMVDYKGFVSTDSMTCLYNADPVAAELYNGVYYSPQNAWGYLDSDNMFGTGAVDGVKVAAVSQVFDKPISPLFVTKVFVEGCSSSKPIAEGQQLTLLFTGVKEVERTYNDGSTAIVKVPDLDKVFDSMIANANDTIDFFSTMTRNSKTIKDGIVVFQKPGEEDILGNVIPGNIVIDEAFAIVIQGFDNDGIDFGPYGTSVEEYDDNTIEKGWNIYADGTSSTFSSQIAVAMSLYGMYDKAYAPKVPGLYTFEDESLDYRIVRVPATGATEEYGFGCCTEGATGAAFATGVTTDAGYPGAPVFTNVSWFDENENGNYFVAELPEWVDGISVDPTFGYGMNLVMFAVQPLPAGETGRWAVVNVYGQEAEMNGEYKYSAISEPIILLQGDATINDVTAIAGIKGDKKRSNTAIYNLAGQRVADGYKGLVIKDGKKFFVK